MGISQKVGRGRREAKLLPSKYQPPKPASIIGLFKRFPCFRMEGQSELRSLVIYWSPRQREVFAQVEYRFGAPWGFISQGEDTWIAFPPHITTTAKAKHWLRRRRLAQIAKKISAYQAEAEKLKGVKLDGNY